MALHYFPIHLNHDNSNLMSSLSSNPDIHGSPKTCTWIYIYLPTSTTSAMFLEVLIYIREYMSKFCNLTLYICALRRVTLDQQQQHTTHKKISCRNRFSVQISNPMRTCYIHINSDRDEWAGKYIKFMCFVE